MNIRKTILLLGAFTALNTSAVCQDNPGAVSYNATKDVEVATFYMNKGDVDAAIDRLQDAIKVKPSYAKPREMLGEAYEKKGFKGEAVKYYKEYLTVLPNASDAKKIQKRIDKLNAEIAKDSHPRP